MKDGTLFGYLASRFSSSPENLATEALAFLLGRSSEARGAMLSIPAASGLDLGGELAFRTQVTDAADQAIPDLVGFDAAGRAAMIVEAKFWAGLTMNQPNAYWDRLSATEPSVLMFLAPTKRLPTLWPELLRLLRADVTAIASSHPEASAARDAEGRMLLLVGWPRLLGAIQARIEAAGELRLLEDLHQLQGLCARMDDEAFLPLGSEELTDLRFARRYLQFTAVVDDLVDAGVRAQILSTQGYRTVSGRGHHTRYLRLAAQGAMIQCDLRKWSQMQETPFWLTVWGTNFRGSASVRSALQSLEIESPPRMFIDADSYDGVAIPLRAPIGVERPEVIEALLAQVRDIRERVDGIEPEPSAAGADDAPPEIGIDD